MSLLGKSSISKKENYAKFIPFHHLGLFHRTLSAAQKGEGVVCSMLCVSSVEAFINDLIGWYTCIGSNFTIFHENDRPVNNYLTDDERNLLEVLNENDRIKLLEKLDFFGEWNKSDKLYQNFKNLISIRNGLTHLKPEELSICKSTGEYTGYPKYLNNLFQMKIIKKPECVASWIESLEEIEFCLWCQGVTYEVVQKLKSMLPETNIKREFIDRSYFFFDVDNFRERYSWSDNKNNISGNEQT